MARRGWFRAALALVALAAGPEAAAAEAVERPRGADRELVGRRTTHATTWELRSGERVTRVAAGPVRWRDGDNRWKAYDFDLRSRTDGPGYVAAAGPARIILPAHLGSGADGATRIEHNGASVTSWLTGASAGAAARDETAAYAEALPSVEVRLRAVPEGLKEELLLADRDAPRSFEYRLRLSDGLSARIARSGAVVIERGERVAFEIPAPSVRDSAALPSRGPTPRYRLARDANGEYRLSFSLSAAWLAAPRRAWPIVVDPTTSFTSRYAATRHCQLTAIVARAASGSTDVTTSSGSDCDNPNEPTARVGGVTGVMDPARPWSDGYRQHTSRLTFEPIVSYLGRSDAVDSAKLILNTTAGTGEGLRALGRANVADLTSIGTIPRTPASGRVEMNVVNIVGAWQQHRSDSARGFAQAPIDLTTTSTRDLVNNFAGAARECWGGGDCPRGEVTISSSTAPDPSQRPYLEVVSIPRANGGALLSPKEGATTERRVELQAHGGALVRSIRFQYVAGSGREWRDIPVAALRFARPVGGSTTVSDPEIPVDVSTGASGVDSKLVVWDLQATPGGEVDGSVHVRAILDDATFADGGVTRVVNVRLDRRNGETSTTAGFGPGSVDLLSGDFTMTTSDVDVEGFPTSLAVSRTFHSRGTSSRDGEMFGPHWAASFDAGGEMPYKSLYNYSEIDEDLVERWVLAPRTHVYEQTFDMPPSALCTEFYDEEIEDFAVECEEMPNDPVDVYDEFTTDEWTPMTDVVRWRYDYAQVEMTDGGKMTLRRESNDRGVDGVWQADASYPGYEVANVGGGFTLTDPSGGATRFERDAADSPSYHPVSYTQAGGDAFTPVYTWSTVLGQVRLTRVEVAGYRSLDFTWASDAATGHQPRVKSISLSRMNWPSGTIQMTPAAVYEYDGRGRLTAVTAEQSGGLAIRYAYDDVDRLVTVTPPGETPWRLSYRFSDGDGNAGRLKTVTRAAPGLGEATWTIRYDVPLSGRDAPRDMSADAVAAWGQSDVPTDATAVYPPSAAAAAATGGFNGATVSYMNVRGERVNVLEPGGALDMTQFDAFGNEARTLSPANRERALTHSNPVRASALLSTINTYDDERGANLESTMGPLHRMKLRSGAVVQGRTRTLTSYDEGKPETETTYNVKTSESTHAFYLDDRGEWQTADALVIVYAYTQDGTKPNRGWELRQPTSVTVDPGGLALTTATTYNEQYPLVRAIRRPAHRGTAGHARRYAYFGVDSSCPLNGTPISHTVALTLVCQTTTTVDSGDAPVVRTSFIYNGWQEPLFVTERDAANVEIRRTVNSYDEAGRLATTHVTGAEAGAETPLTRTTYDTATGRVASVAVDAVGTAPARTVSKTYDSNGRVSTYTDATGAVTRYRYGLDGELLEQEDPKGTTTFDYDARGLNVAMTDSTLRATVTGSYDADGKLVRQQFPNGLSSEYSYDETGAPTNLEVLRTGCTADCAWVEQHLTLDAHGRWVEESTGAAGRERTFAYDGVGRLSRVEDRAGGSCTTRVYQYDANSNRTSRSVHPAASGGACSTSTTPAVQSLTYDSADRALSSGLGRFAYDALGRTTTAPATATDHAITSTYYADDRALTVTQDGVTQTYSYDPMQRTLTRQTSGRTTATETSHYGDDSDSPMWSATGLTTWKRYVPGLVGDVVATVEQDGTTRYPLADLHGDVVAVASDSPTATVPVSRSTFDEFGVPLTGRGGRYGWLGGKQRSTDFDSGVMQMGVRTYVPQLGRFLQVDPIDGGSANAYDYAGQNPITQFDLDGRLCVPCGLVIGGMVAGAIARRAAIRAAARKGLSKPDKKWTAQAERHRAQVEKIMRENEKELMEWIGKGQRGGDGSWFRRIRRGGRWVKVAIDPPHDGIKSYHMQGTAWSKDTRKSHIKAYHHIKDLCRHYC